MIKLNEEEAKALASTLRRLQARSSKPLDLPELLRRWHTFVAEVEHGYELTGYDYANDLATRDMLDEVVSSAPPRIRDRILHEALDLIDAQFHQATRGVTEPLRIASPERPRWWWFRIPNDLSGELASDLLSPQDR